MPAKVSSTRKKLRLCTSDALSSEEKDVPRLGLRVWNYRGLEGQTKIKKKTKDVQRLGFCGFRSIGGSSQGLHWLSLGFRGAGVRACQSQSFVHGRYVSFMKPRRHALLSGCGGICVAVKAFAACCLQLHPEPGFQRVAKLMCVCSSLGFRCVAVDCRRHSEDVWVR